MNQPKIVHSIITTKTPDDWFYIKQAVQHKFARDISNMLPIFLSLDDFHNHRDPSFNAAEIFSAWWVHNKIPVIVLKNMDEWENYHIMKRTILENSSVFID